MPVRDAERTLRESIDSLLSEDTENIEFILVDDGSQDDSLSILQSYEKRDLRVRVLPQPRRGLVAALNAGLQISRGVYLGRHDADDISITGRFLKQADFLAKNPEMDLVASRCQMFCDNGPVGMGMLRWEKWTNAFLDHKQMYRERFIESPMAHSAVMFRCQRLRTAGGYRDGDFPEDYELWLRLFSLGYKFGRLGDTGVRVRDHERRSIRNLPQYRAEAFQDLKIAHLKTEFFTPGEPVLILGGGRIAKSWVSRLQAADVPVAGMVDVYEGRWGKVIRGVPVFSPGEARAGRELSRFKALGAVGRIGAREEIRSQLPALGRKEGKDFLFVA